MALPRKALIGPFTYHISEKLADWERLDHDLDKHYGLTDKRAGIILLDPNMDDPALVRTILLHELLHACAFAGGIMDQGKRTEEDFVASVAPMLLDAVTRSPGMAAFLFGGRA